MNELQTNKLHELVQLRVGHRSVANYSEGELKRECSTIIGRAFTYSTPNGQPSPDVLQHQSNELFNALKGRYSTLTIPEVQKCFKYGLDGVYGAYFGLCGKTYSQFLKGYFDNPERGREWLKYLDDINKPLVAEIPEHIKKAMSIESIQKRFLEFKKSGNLGFCAWATYDLIKTLKGVKSLITLSQFAEIKEKTIGEWTEKYTSEMDKAKRKGNNTVAESIANILAVGVDKDETVLKRQKEIALRMFFDSINKLEI